MKCINHPELDAVGACVGCGRELCLECKRELDGKLYCWACADATPSVAVANGNKAKASILARASLACAIFGILGIGGGILITVIVLIANGGMMDDNDWLLPSIVFPIAFTLILLAVIFGVVSLLRKPTPASRKIAKMGLLLIVILFILFGLLWINDKVHGG